MRILACDTSTKILSVAVVEDGKVIKSYHSAEGGESDYLFVVIDKFLKSLKIKLSDFDLFAVGLGPGSFTGLRIGTCAFKTFAFTANKSLVGINSFEAIACNFKDTDRVTYVVEDARKDKVYAAGFCFDKKHNLKIKQKCALFDIETLLEKLEKIKEPVVVAGGGMKRYGEQILSSGNKKNSPADEKFWYPKAEIVARLAAEKFKDGKTDDSLKLVPLYLHSERANITKPRKLLLAYSV